MPTWELEFGVSLEFGVWSLEFDYARTQTLHSKCPAGSRAGGGVAAARPVDGGHGPAQIAGHTLGAGHPNLGLRARRRRHLVYGVAVATSGFVGVGHRQRETRQSRLWNSAGIRPVRGRAG